MVSSSELVVGGVFTDSSFFFFFFFLLSSFFFSLSALGFQRSRHRGNCIFFIFSCYRVTAASSKKTIMRLCKVVLLGAVLDIRHLSAVQYSCRF